MLFPLVMVKFGIVKLYHTSTESRFWGIYGSDPDSFYHHSYEHEYTHPEQSVPKSSTYFNIEHIQILTHFFFIRGMFLYIVHDATTRQP